MEDKADASAIHGDATHNLHPVYTISNIPHKVHVLDGTKASYDSWVKLFMLLAKGYHVLYHIDGMTPPTKDSPELTAWENIDSIVLQWIYGTLLDDLLIRVLTDESTALEAWQWVKHLFVNNKGPRSQALQHELANLTLASMSNLETYCQKIHELTDQLKALEFPMNDQQRVLHLGKGLRKEYNTIASILNQSLPSWEDVVDQLMCEAGHLKTRDVVTNTLAIAAAIPPPPPSQAHTPPHPNPSPTPHPPYYPTRGPNTLRNNSRPNHNHNRGPNNFSHNQTTPPQHSYSRSFNQPPPYPNQPQQQPPPSPLSLPHPELVSTLAVVGSSPISKLPRQSTVGTGKSY
ncbi:hypothetical protein HanRHA438_Chr16g0742361 [Helianthus annuus]|nr:hypothetical protein HanRHA438_Chr16g0742361 [Helianthus annuus]